VFRYILLISFNLFSQNVILEVDTASLRIGEQFNATLKIYGSELDSVVLPASENTFDSFELLNNPVLSTYNQEDTYIYKNFLLTSFDTGQFILNSVPVFFSGKDSLFSNPVSVNFLSFPVDTANKFFDIKPPKKIPFLTKELFVYIPYLLLIVFVLVLVYVFFKYFKRTNHSDFVLKKTLVPIDVYFLSKLDELLKKDYLDDEQYKEFYTELSEIFRGYLELRFSIPALESSTHELRIFLEDLKIKESWVNSFLRNSDIVKFAKGMSSKKESVEFLEKARAFVVKFGIVDDHIEEINDKLKK